MAAHFLTERAAPAAGAHRLALEDGAAAGVVRTVGVDLALGALLIRLVLGEALVVDAGRVILVAEFDRLRIILLQRRQLLGARERGQRHRRRAGHRLQYKTPAVHHARLHMVHRMIAQSAPPRWRLLPWLMIPPALRSTLFPYTTLFR